MIQEKCPICQKVSDLVAKPFCSRRCADIDLGRWLKGNYVISGQDGEAMSDLLRGDIANENDPEG